MSNNETQQPICIDLTQEPELNELNFIDLTSEGDTDDVIITNITFNTAIPSNTEPMTPILSIHDEMKARFDNMQQRLDRISTILSNRPRGVVPVAVVPPTSNAQ